MVKASILNEVPNALMGRFSVAVKSSNADHLVELAVGDSVQRLVPESPAASKQDAASQVCCFNGNVGTTVAVSIFR